MTQEKDWTRDPETGRSNSSKLFLSLMGVVAQLIRGNAHDLIAGNTISVARLIVATLAHQHGLQPEDDHPEAIAAEEAERVARVTLLLRPEVRIGEAMRAVIPHKAFASGIRIVIFQDGDPFVVQGVDHDIAAQGNTSAETLQCFRETVAAELALGRGALPAKPPAIFQLVWNMARPWTPEGTPAPAPEPPSAPAPESPSAGEDQSIKGLSITDKLRAALKEGGLSSMISLIQRTGLSPINVAAGLTWLGTEVECVDVPLKSRPDRTVTCWALREERARLKTIVAASLQPFVPVHASHVRPFVPVHVSHVLDREPHSPPYCTRCGTDLGLAYHCTEVGRHEPRNKVLGCVGCKTCEPRLGEKLGEYRARLGLPGTDTQAALHLVRTEGGWVWPSMMSFERTWCAPTPLVPPVPPARRAKDEAWPLPGVSVEAPAPAKAPEPAKEAPKGPHGMAFGPIEVNGAWYCAEDYNAGCCYKYTEGIYDGWSSVTRDGVEEGHVWHAIALAGHYRIQQLEATLLDYQHALEAIRSSDCGRCNSDTFAQRILKQPTHGGLLKAIVAPKQTPKKPSA